MSVLVSAGVNFLDSLPNNIELFISFASFEDRCLLAPSLIANQLVVDKAYIFSLNEFSSETQENHSKLLEMFNGKAQSITFSHGQPTEIADKIFSILKNESIGKKSGIVVDISTFNKESLLILIRILKILENNFKYVKFIYSAARTAKNLSSGVVEIRSVIGYLGNILPSKPLHLIVMSGFEHDRANAIIETYEPDFISIGYGSKDSSINLEMHELNVEFTEKVAAWYEPGVVVPFEYSLQDPENAKESIEMIAATRPNCNVVVVPLNNKLSTIGAGLFAIENDDVQICYSQMANFNTDDYSVATGDFYVLDMFSS